MATHPDNPRPELGDLSEMVQSMRSVGVVQPVLVTTRQAHIAAHPEHASVIGDTQYVIIAGHRRAAAAMEAQIDEVPVEIRPELSADGLDIEVMAVENLQRRDLNPVEEAVLFRKLACAGRSQRQIAKRVGRAQSHVSKRLALLDLPAEVRTRVAAGELEITDALALASGSRARRAPSSVGEAPRYPACSQPESRRVLDNVRVRDTTRDGRPELRDRDWCCSRLATRVPTASLALQRLADGVLQLSPSEEALTLAHRWLRRAGIGPDIDDPSEYARVVGGAGSRLRRQVAHAVVVAADELRLMRAQHWQGREVSHVRRLMTEVGYLPDERERFLLAQHAQHVAEVQHVQQVPEVPQVPQVPEVQHVQYAQGTGRLSGEGDSRGISRGVA